MSEAFEIYQSSLKTNFAKITKAFDDLTQCETLSTKQDILSSISNCIEDSDKAIKAIEIQVATEYANDSNFEMYVNNYKNGLNQHKVKYLKEKEKVESEEQSLILTPCPTDRPLKEVNETIALRSFETLQKAKLATTEIESTGQSIMIEMNSQSEKMKGTTNKIHNINDQLSDSTTLINDMEAHNKRNNRIICIFSIGLVLAFFFILASKLYPLFLTSKNENTEQTAS